MRVNVNGLTFDEWYAAATAGEARKLKALAAVMGANPPRPRRWRSRAEHAAELLGEPAKKVYRRGVRSYALSAARARRAWREGQDPTEYAAAPRPLPRGFGKAYA